MRLGKSAILMVVAAGLAPPCAAPAAVLTLRNGWDPVNNVADPVNGYTGTRDDTGASNSYTALNLDDGLYFRYSSNTVASVVGFDISQYGSQIGTLSSATLEMTFSAAPWFAGATVAVRNPTAQWTEGGAFFYKTPADYWNPADMTNTWDPTKGMTMYGQPDIDSEVIPAHNNGAGQTGYTVSLDVTSLVHTWLSNSENNRGFALVRTASSLVNNAYWAGKANATAAYRPTLVLDYSPVPEPAGLMLLVGSGGLLLIRHRRDGQTA